MGIFNDDEKQTKTGKCQIGPRGPPGLSIKGAPGKDAVLPPNIILDDNASFKADVLMNDFRITDLKLVQDTDYYDTDAVSRKFVHEKLAAELNVIESNVNDLDNEIQALDTDTKNSLDTKMNKVVSEDIDLRNTYKIINSVYPTHDHSLVPKAYVDSNFLEKSGDYMHGDLSMAGTGVYHEILGVKDGIFDHSVVTKKYVDTNLQQNLNVSLQNVLLLDGSQAMSGSINMQNNRIYNLKDIDQNTDENTVVTKKYVDSRSSSQNVSFEHMTEFLYNGNPFYLAKQAAKRTDYIIFQQDKSLVHTNSV